MRGNSRDSEEKVIGRKEKVRENERKIKIMREM